MSANSTAVPRLLVSVRSAAEAEIAVSHGADIVDVKEPANGSLGRASASVMREIEDVVGASRHVFTSVALGELREWLVESNEIERRAVIDVLPYGQFAKLGLSNLVNDGRLDSDWELAWQRTMQALSRSVSWVAVSYADHERAAAPTPDEVIDAAIRARCRIVLIDTFLKDGTSLLDWLSIAQLTRLRNRCRDSAIQLALAGRIEQHHLTHLRSIEPDIIAVRGAVCGEGDRTAAVCADRLAIFRAQLLSIWASTAVPAGVVETQPC